MSTNDEFYKELSEVIDKYALNKSEKDSYDKLVKEDGDKIKSMMYEAELLKYSTETNTISYVVQHRQSFDEAKLIGIIHTNNLPESLGIIKTKEYIDEDALESAIYNGEISEEVMEQIQSCLESKDVVTLRLSKSKKESK